MEVKYKKQQKDARDTMRICIIVLTCILGLLGLALRWAFTTI